MNPEETQTEFNRLVNRGIILGSVWILGIGSIIALTSGFQAGRLFDLTGKSLKGENKIYKCYLIGAIGLLIDITAVLIIIFLRKK